MIWMRLRSLIGWAFIGLGVRVMHVDDPDLAPMETLIHEAAARMARERKLGEPQPLCPVCRDYTCEGERYHHIHGAWGPRDRRRAFVAGAQWWEFESTGGTMWGTDRNWAEEEAERRYGVPAA